MKDYHLGFWELNNELPADFVDDLMHADYVESVVSDERMQKN